jgi:hypothetical protein
MRRDRWRRDPGMAESDHGVIAIGVQRKRDRGLPGSESLDATPGQHDFLICDDLKVRSLHPQAAGICEAEHAPGASVGLRVMGEPGHYLMRISQQRKHRRQFGSDSSFAHDLTAVVHFDADIQVGSRSDLRVGMDLHRSDSPVVLLTPFDRGMSKVMPKVIC